MPTARELLEQADALMRRKQDAAAPRIDGAESLQGPTTDSAFVPTHAPAPATPAALASPTARGDAPPPGTAAAAVFSAMRWSAPAAPAGMTTTSPAFAPPPLVSPRTIQREPIAPSVARTALPVDPTEPPAFPAPAPALVPASVIEQDFPTLVDAVDAEAIGEHPDGVPLLTDAVDPLSDEPILEDLDEPSVWTPTLGGATTVRAGAPSPSPAVPVAPASPPSGRDPLGLDRPPPGFVPAPAAQWTDREPPADGVPMPARVAETPSALGAAEVAAPAVVVGVAPPVVVDVPTPVVIDHAPPVVIDVSPPVVVDDAAPVAFEAPPAGVVEVPRAAAFEALLPVGESPPPAAVEAEAVDVEVVEAMPVAEAAPAHAVLAPLDDARVREIAEEIGMQVLQRIDIFTDTELRARLGERLKPVVDRVSVDLVTAINQHVGELLRAYVAEAIEREIDGWRNRQ
jgi:hypothetical protein